MKRIRLIRMVTCLLFLVALLIDRPPIQAEVWDYSCENSIRQLMHAQQEASSAHDDLTYAKSDLESARSTHEMCTVTDFSDCSFERMNLNNAIDRYNMALSNLESAVDSFNRYVYSFRNSFL